MVNYQLGKIYRIVCDTTGLVYYGSTCDTLGRRLAKHRYQYKVFLENNKDHHTTSIAVLENDNYKIVLVEHVSCGSKEELLMRERFYIENNICVNRKVPGRTNQEYRAENIEELRRKERESHHKNKEERNIQSKNHYALNKEDRKIKSKNYHLANLDVIKAQKREYYQRNKERIIEKSRLHYLANKERAN